MYLGILVSAGNTTVSHEVARVTASRYRYEYFRETMMTIAESAMKLYKS